MKFEAGYFRSTDGKDLFFRHWKPDGDPVATVFVVHGLGEHSGRYSEFAQAATDREFEVFAMDNRGHGRSEGKRGHIARFQEFVEDLRTFWLRFAPERNLPTFVVGQSLGALIAFHYAHRYGADLTGVVFCSGAFELPPDLPKWRIAAAKILRRIAPSFTMKHNLRIECLSADQSVVEAYLDDPYVHDRVSINFFFEIQKAMGEARSLARQLRLPLLTLHGSEDCLVAARGSREVYENWAGQPKEFVMLDGERHDLFHGSAKTRTFETILSWCLKVSESRQQSLEENHV